MTPWLVLARERAGVVDLACRRNHIFPTVPSTNTANEPLDARQNTAVSADIGWRLRESSGVSLGQILNGLSSGATWMITSP